MLTLEKFEEASEVVKKVTQETKLVYSEYFSNQSGNKVYFKPENMQLTGAYKLRGAYYKISTLTEEERGKGLITASAETSPGRSLCCQVIWLQVSYCHAYHDTLNESKPYEKLRGGGCALRRCL